MSTARGKSVPGRPTPAQRLAQSLRDKRRNGQSVRQLRGQQPRIVGSQSNGDGMDVAAPVSTTRIQRTGAPRVSGMSGTDLRVRVVHREYIQDINNNAAAFTPAQLSVNPGLSTVFPWLSTIATNFEAYRFRKLVFQYRTATATSTIGKFLMALDYDAADATPSTKVSMMQERTKADGPVWANFDMAADPADLLKFPQRYIRNGSLAANLDVKTYDVGNLNTAIASGTGSAVAGELWVEYDVELITPNSSIGPAAGAAAKIVSNGSITPSNIFGSSATITTANGLSVSAINNSLTFNQVGTYMVEIARTGTVLAPMTIVTGVSTALATERINAAGTDSVVSWKFTVSSIGSVVTFGNTDATTTAMVTRISSYSLT